MKPMPWQKLQAWRCASITGINMECFFIVPCRPTYMDLVIIITENSHVLPALIRRFHEAKENLAEEVVIWGTGKPRRELMHVDDLAAGVLFLLEIDSPPDWVNLGTGIDHSISEIANLVKEVVGFYWEKYPMIYPKPDGMPVKRLDVSLAQSLGWTKNFFGRRNPECLRRLYQISGKQYC